MLGSTKLWSPNAATNKNVGGTIIKFGKYRFDVEAGRGLHVAWIMFGRKVNHIPLGIILGVVAIVMYFLLWIFPDVFEPILSSNWCLAISIGIYLVPCIYGGSLAV